MDLGKESVEQQYQACTSTASTYREYHNQGAAPVGLGNMLTIKLQTASIRWEYQDQITVARISTREQVRLVRVRRQRATLYWVHPNQGCQPQPRSRSGWFE